MMILIVLFSSHLLHNSITADTETRTEAKFDQTLISSKYFVDKSKLIKDFFRRNIHKGIFVTRPSGFGKTTNLRMIQKFCQVEVDPRTKNLIAQEKTEAYELFKDLKIAKLGHIVQRHLARHPVLYLDLTQFVIEGELTKHAIVDASDEVVKQALEEFSWLDGLYDKWNQTLPPYSNETQFCTSIRDFTNFLSKYFNGTDLIILIDGYDVALQRALDNLDMVREVHMALQRILQYLITCGTIKRNLLITAESSLFLRSDNRIPLMRQDRFLTYSSYVAHFGFHEAELHKLMVKNYLNRDHVDEMKKYYGGYKVPHRHLSLFSPSLIIKYLSNRASSKDPLPKYKIGPNRTKILWRFLRHPRFLRGASQLIKNCPITYNYLEDLNLSDVDHFIESILLNRNSTESHYRIHLTYSLQMGYIIRVSRHTYTIANLEMRNIFLTDLRYHYEDWLKINITQLGNCLLDFTQAPDESINHNSSIEPLQAALIASFQKLGQVPDNDTTNEFTFQSIIHIAALMNPYLTVDEDYPSPMLQNYTRELVRKQCVTFMRCGDTATLVKITHRQSAETALEVARKYYTYRVDSIKKVKYLAIDVGKGYELSLQQKVVDL